MGPRRRSNNRGVRIPNILEKGLDPLAMEKEGSVGFGSEDKGNEEDADFSEPEFKRRVAEEDDFFNDDNESEKATPIHERIPNFRLTMGTSSTSSTTSTSSTSKTPKKKSKRRQPASMISDESDENFYLLDDSVGLIDLEIGFVCFLFVDLSINMAALFRFQAEDP